MIFFFFFLNSARKKKKKKPTPFFDNIQVVWREIHESEVIHTMEPNLRFFHILGESLDKQVCNYTYAK